MAEEAVAEESTEVAKPSLVKTLMIPVVVGVVCAGIGFAVPMAMPGLVGNEPAEPTTESVDPLFLKFGEVVVNLNEARMTRYLRLGMSVQVAGTPEEEPELLELIEKKRAIMTSWLLGYLADMKMEDIRGASGQNRLRREITDQFSWVLFPEGDRIVDDVLFEEFNVQ